MTRLSILTLRTDVFHQPEGMFGLIPWPFAMQQWWLTLLVLLTASERLVFGQDRNVRPHLWDKPGIQVYPEQSATSLKELISAGKNLFEAKMNVVDGAGRPGATGDSKPTVRFRENDPGFMRTSGPDALSCVACHNQPVTGGSGDFVANVFVGAQFRDPPITSIAFKDTSERNTLGLFGAGAIEMLSREMSADLQAIRRAALSEAKNLNQEVSAELITKGVSFGRIVGRPDGTFDASSIKGVDPDLVIKPFSFKGVVISLREFSINALNQHSGIQAWERFGWERTGSHDFDEDGVEVEFTEGQVTALTLFQASLPAPKRGRPKTAEERIAIRRGEEGFRKIGCAECHIPELPLQGRYFIEPNPFNRPGNLNVSDTDRVIRLRLPKSKDSGVRPGVSGGLIVAAFSDLKRHKISDESDSFFANERIRQDNVPTDQFLTAKLWDLSTSAPYGHRGDCTTISEVIIHHAGEAKASRDGFLALDEKDKRAVVSFLSNLGAGED